MHSLLRATVDWSPVWNALVYLLAAALLAVAPLLALLLIEARRWLLARIRDDARRAALAQAFDAAAVHVKALEQTLRRDVERARADGKLTPAEGEALARTAVQRVLQTLGSAGREALDAATGVLPVDQYVRAAVEAAVLDVHVSKPARLEAAALATEVSP